MFLDLITKKTIHDGARKKARSAKHAEHKRYYAKTAFKYEHRPWTVTEDKRVLAYDILDSELSPTIKCSMKSISSRRWRLCKAAPENKRIGKAGEQGEKNGE